jgi:hypothetical protein
MAHTFLVFDFGEDETTAQQARLRIEGWKQGFRLDQKVQLVFDRSEGEAEPESTKKKSQAGKQVVSGISLIVRLDSPTTRCCHSGGGPIPSEELLIR